MGQRKHMQPDAATAGSARADAETVAAPCTPPAAPRRRSLAHRVREQMEEYIRSGQWQVGQRIPPEPELIRHFGVSHNTLREAVQGLIHAGMLMARPGDGTYVTAADRLDAALAHRLQQADLSRILEARLAIEKAVVALAAQNRNDEDLDRIVETNQKGTMRCMRAATKRMTTGASIVNVASIAGERGCGELCPTKSSPSSIKSVIFSRM